MSCRYVVSGRRRQISRCRAGYSAEAQNTRPRVSGYHQRPAEEPPRESFRSGLESRGPGPASCLTDGFRFGVSRGLRGSSGVAEWTVWVSRQSLTISCRIATVKTSRWPEGISTRWRGVLVLPQGGFSGLFRCAVGASPPPALHGGSCPGDGPHRGGGFCGGRFSRRARVRRRRVADRLRIPGDSG